MPLEIVRNDITKMTTDAIVNAANSHLKRGGGVCGAVFNAAGAQALQKVCDQIGYCAVGRAVHTDAFALNAKYIIHTVGPVWQGGSHNEEERLRDCYKNSLELAYELGCESISFPLISTGIFGYPKEPALQIAISAIDLFLKAHEMHVSVVVFDKQSFGISKKLYRSISAFIDDNEASVLEEKSTRYRKKSSSEPASSPEAEVNVASHLQAIFKGMNESFSQRLLRFIDEKEMTDTETYKKANIDRKLFSKIRNNTDYTPLKKTIIAFAIALELDLAETEDLLEKAGYRLSRSHKFDLIILYFIERKNYDIHEINEALFAFDQMLLGA
ncbi:macro domain-containing protein [Planococcus kocurii]|uniref:macro domain-containing protein n=1 Tax=Planococcus TaxID=1372 RepID=UPI0011F07636|nr:macro domain-containing protein [Planococcus sp. ANT_H30]KAA0956494.1 RNase III inhibitor [Planococcus sp. ANT_H30]